MDNPSELDCLFCVHPSELDLFLLILCVFLSSHFFPLFSISRFTEFRNGKTVIFATKFLEAE